MSTYHPPVKDMAFILNHIVGLHDLPQAADLDAATIDAVLEEAGKLAHDVLDPINKGGDEAGNTLKDGVVTTAPGFKEAYAQFREGGWNAVPFNPDHGGQGLPWALAFAVQEMWQAANLSFGLCPLLTQGAVEAIEAHGSSELKADYLEKMISGEWTGTMNLTEPQAGSDLAAVKTKAERVGDGTYKIFGQKIFITYGEHDFTDNIIHLVLARLPDAPEGVKGISLFVVPKILKDGTRNDVICTGIEHKIGIHASPTCTMQYGDSGGATGYVVGQENEGLKYMFTMMNMARLCVGLQGVAVAERAYQHALAYARDRVQGKPLDGSGATIIHHPDVKRMLLSMKAQIEGARALTYAAALAVDKANAGDAAAQARVDLLTPIVKAWSTDMGVEVASTGVQIHGGMGFIEETGAAQYYRDARILPIYEGTNGIQANDLVFRKILRDGGAAAQAWLEEIAAYDLGPSFKAVQDATAWVLKAGKVNDLSTVAAVAVPYLRAFSILSCGAMMAKARAALPASGMDADFIKAKTATIDFYMAHIMPQALGQAEIVMNGAASVKDVDPALL
ncbi:MAG: acyl-CoA dehydrogenase, middle domain protein [Micavibrio sp.]|nr:acyl-CoA dehydrogenase, middle domain protein [Micavibrio sp.]